MGWLRSGRKHGSLWVLEEQGRPSCCRLWQHYLATHDAAQNGCISAACPSSPTESQLPLGCRHRGPTREGL